MAQFKKNRVLTTKIRLRVDKPQLVLLQNEFNISEAGLYNALAGRSNSQRAKDIRQRARDMGAAVEATYQREQLVI